LTESVAVLHPVRHKIGHFGDVLPRQSPGTVSNSHTSGIQQVLTVIYLQMNGKALVVCNFNFHIVNERLVKVTGS